MDCFILVTVFVVCRQLLATRLLEFADCCLTDDHTRMFGPETLMEVLMRLAVKNPLPSTFMRLCIRTLERYGDLKSLRERLLHTIAGLLKRAEMYDDARHWTGLIGVLKRSCPISFPVFAKLRGDKVRS